MASPSSPLVFNEDIDFESGSPEFDAAPADSGSSSFLNALWAVTKPRDISHDDMSRKRRIDELDIDINSSHYSHTQGCGESLAGGSYVGETGCESNSIQKNGVETKKFSIQHRDIWTIPKYLVILGLYYVHKIPLPREKIHSHPEKSPQGRGTDHS